MGDSRMRIRTFDCRMREQGNDESLAIPAADDILAGDSARLVLESSPPVWATSSARSAGLTSNY